MIGESANILFSSDFYKSSALPLPAWARKAIAVGALSMCIAL